MNTKKSSLMRSSFSVGATLLSVAGMAVWEGSEIHAQEPVDSEGKVKFSEKSLMEAVQQTAAQKAVEASAPAPAPAPAQNTPAVAPPAVSAPSVATPPVGTPESAEIQKKLSEAEARIAALEKQLSMAKTPAGVETRGSQPTVEEKGKKQTERVEADLFSQVEELRRKVGNAIPANYLADTTVKRPRASADGSGGYDSEIKFKIRDGYGQLSSLVFPIQSTPEGLWRLPDSKVVQQKIGAFLNNKASVLSAATAASTPAVHAHSNAYVPTPLPLPPGGQRVPATGPQHTQVVPDTYVIQWAGQALNSSITQSTAVLQPVSMVPSPPLPVPAVQGRPAPAFSPAPQAPQPAATPAAPPRPAAPAVPAPVMPVQESVQIRFE